MNRHNSNITLLPGRLLGIRLVQQEFGSSRDQKSLKKLRYSAKIGSKDGVKNG
ncbi:MAG: hypothetical protein R3318_06470 [Gammaproteobacteria bacterium]|nr:hypothetical protein [Gammaproteobacteria bacterium]